MALSATAAMAQGIEVASMGTDRVLFMAGPAARATVILLPGGDGIVAIDDSGNIHAGGGNFLIRTRDLWRSQGFNVVVPGHTQTRIGQRSTPRYAAELDWLAEFARLRSPAPVWVIGTSQGSMAAVNAGAHVAKLGGVVMTSSVTQRSRADETVFDSDPGAITIPALVVANTGDGCGATPPGDAARILAALTRSPRKELILVDSHEARSDPCGAQSPHGFLGIESSVVQRIGSRPYRRAGPRSAGTLPFRLKMDDLIRAAGWGADALETGYMKGPKPWTPMYEGAATR
jgi:hypothetical protein